MRKRLKHYTTVVRKLAQGTHLLVTPIKKISGKGRDRDDAAVGRKFALVKAVSRRLNRLAKEGSGRHERVTRTNLPYKNIYNNKGSYTS